jgi:hypothetical protein
MNIIERAPTQLPLVCQPITAPRPSPAIVIRNELRKYLIVVRTYLSRLAQSPAPVQSPAAILTKVVQRQDSRFKDNRRLDRRQQTGYQLLRTGHRSGAPALLFFRPVVLYRDETAR